MATIRVRVLEGEYAKFKDMVRSLDDEAHCYHDPVEEGHLGAPRVYAYVVTSLDRLTANALQIAGIVYSVDVQLS